MNFLSFFFFQTDNSRKKGDQIKSSPPTDQFRNQMRADIFYTIEETRRSEASIENTKRFTTSCSLLTIIIISNIGWTHKGNEKKIVVEQRTSSPVG